jgi:DNA polymerase III delta prime subunit
MRSISESQKEESVKLLFSLLSREGKGDLSKRKSLAALAEGLSVSKEDLSRWFREWKAGETRGNSTQDPLVYTLLLAALTAENSGERPVSAAVSMAGLSGFSEGLADRLLKGEPALPASLVPRAERIAELIRERDPSDGQDIYIANQVTYEGFDEIQRLAMALHLGFHTALDGPPGVGKTQSVIEIARVFGKQLHTKTCSSRTTESHIIAFPVLTQESGATVTDYVNGPLCLAMEEGEIFYGDEFNLLKEDVQKRMNSAFDERRMIDRPDGKQVKAAPGFWGVISYNPSRNITSRDLEDSVADRFIHVHYSRWTPDFKAFVSMNRAAGTKRSRLTERNEFGIELSFRGVSRGPRFFTGYRDGGELRFRDFFTGEPEREKPDYIYLVYDEGSILKRPKEVVKKALDEFEAQAFSEVEIARMMAHFTEVLHSLSKTGQSPLLAKVGLSNLKEKEDLELLSLHESSARIEIAAMKHFRFLKDSGCNRYLAQAYATRLVVDQVCYGQYRDKKLKESTAYELCLTVAKALRLIAQDTQYNTRLVSEKLLAPPKPEISKKT